MKKILFVLVVIALSFAFASDVMAGSRYTPEGANRAANAGTDVSVEVISGMAGLLLSLAAAYVPKFRGWYAGLSGDDKRLIMLAGLLVSSAGIFAASCAGFAYDLGIPAVACDKGGALLLVRIFVMALVVNQAAYPILPYKFKQ